MFEPLPVPRLLDELSRLSGLLDAPSEDDDVCGPAPGALPDAAVVDGIAAATAVAAWAEALSVRLVGVLRERRRAEHEALVTELGGQAAVERAGGPASVDEVDRFTALDVAAAMRVSQRSAVERVRLAGDLLRRQPATLAALSAGLLGVPHARAVRDALEGAADDVVARRIDRDVIGSRAGRRETREADVGAGTQWSIGTPPQLAASVRRALAHVDAGSLRRRCEAARRRRGVSSWALPDGMAALQVTAPALEVAAVVETLDVHARERVRAATAGSDGAGDVPTLDEARADAALTLLLGTPDLLAQPVPHVSVGVDVLVPLDQLRGSTVGTTEGTAGAGGAGSSEAAELPGFGPLPAPIARAVAREARRVRVVALDQRGAVDVTALPAEDTYRPSARLQRAVRARDTTCRWPGCRRRARGCDVDHTVPYPDGPTSACNLACYCRTHHRAKHRAGWTVSQQQDGHLAHTSPTYGTDPPSWVRVDVGPDLPSGEGANEDLGEETGEEGTGEDATAGAVTRVRAAVPEPGGGPAPGDWWDPAWFRADWYPQREPPEDAPDESAA